MGLSDEEVDYVCDIWRDDRPDCHEDLFDYDYTLHEVTIPLDFWMDTYEVTNEQFQACIDAGICSENRFPVGLEGEQYRGNPLYDDYPVADATFAMADQYCRIWRGGRLPTEAEWEYAARSDNRYLWPWGNMLPDDTLANVGGFSHYPLFQPQPVNSYAAGRSPFGLYHMAGNVEEWVSDFYGPYGAESQKAPAGPAEGDWRITRGGNALWNPIASLTAYRRLVERDGNSIAGIRCVLEAR